MTESELVAWGKRIGASIQPPLWIALRGPLGAGKSVLARSVCQGGGVGGRIPSPSFTLVQEYRSPRGFSIHHVDLFRLRSGDDLGALGWEELMRSSGLVLLEWPERAGGQLPRDRWDLDIAYARLPGERVVRVDRVGDAAELVEW